MVMQELKGDLAYLAGPETRGRLSGTDGAARAASYLAGALADIGLEPAGGQNYFQWLQVPAARLTGPVHLSVGSRELAHRREFAEMAHLCAGARVHSRLLTVREGEEVAAEAVHGSVVLIADRPDGFDLSATASAVAEAGAAALLVEWGEPDWFHKTVHGGQGARIPVLRLRRTLAQALAEKSGAPVGLDLPLSQEALPCRNVLGLLPATLGAEAPTLALTAHYDHLGDDPGGHRFPGALDNASGAAAILEALRMLKAEGTRLPYHLLVGFLTGEESGLWGARQLAADPPRTLSGVINLDMIGLESSLRSVRTGYGEPGDPLADLAASALAERSVSVRWITGSDDSAAFQRAGLSALGLGQMATEPGGVAIHTPDDRPEALHLETVAAGASALVHLLRRFAQVPAILSRPALII